MRGISLFLLGLLTGMIIMNSVQGQRLEGLYWEKEDLKVQLYEKNEQLQSIQEQQEAMLPAVVKEIKLEIKMEENDFVEPALKKEIYDLASGVLGHEIRALPYSMVINLLENREVEAEGKAYRLDVEAVIIGETLTYYLKAEK